MGPEDLYQTMQNLKNGYGEALPGKEIGTEDVTVTDTGRVIFTLLVSDLFCAILNEC